MSENIYRLDLTERELNLIGAASSRLSWIAHGAGDVELSAEYEAIRQKLRALEPIGTGGTTTTEGA